MRTAMITKPGKVSAYAGLGDILADGLDPVLLSDDQMIRIRVDEIEIETQVREEFEDDEHTLEQLGESLAKRQLQNIVVRPNRAGKIKPYLLVIGERRVRSAVLQGQADLWALVAHMNDEDAEAAQLAENIQRKNLTLLEEAKRVQRDLKALGSTEALLAKHHKSPGWLSKRLALLDLSPQAARLIKENVSADIEVVNAVRTIERADAPKAQKLVDELKAGRGKVNAREAVAAVKAEVKPSKRPAAKAGAGSEATARDRSHEEPSQARVFAGAKTPPARPAHEEALQRAYTAIFEEGKTPQAVLDGLADKDRDAVEVFLHTFYEAGRQATDAARIVIDGFRRGGFATDGVGAFALVAYLHGTDGRARFNLLNVFGCLKP